MEDNKNLYDTIGGKAYNLGIHKPEIPKYILDNLKYVFFDWQKNALESLLTFQAIKAKENSNNSTHLMFNMATGTGKTLLMAATILYYYKQGYRHFLFFVNQNNIVDKTENNFIDSFHTKYLFTKKIIIDDKTINIKKVNFFNDATQEIEIKFTSIQKLYNDIHLQKENQTTLNDLHNKNIVMLADEAHHLNTDTSKKKNVPLQPDIIKTSMTGRTSAAEVEKKGWEHTVIDLILNKNGNKQNNKNVLLEFTATIPTTEAIAKKYADKIIYKFGLKEFLQAGYTKEINLISSTLNQKERVLQALLFHWYRHKIALKYKIANFKPVILFRSKTILESKVDYKDFLTWIENISADDFTFFKIISSKISPNVNKNIYEQGKSRTEQVLSYIKNEKITFSEIANWMKKTFSEKNIIITNSKENTSQIEKTTVETEKLLNSLEDINNNIRAIFTVDRLTEGWDVLNLFDIVRLYQGQNSGGSTKKIPEATTKEKQLIGRGVRYYPFYYNDKIKNKRKFDDNLDHELRVLEELYYYTYDEDSRYISHLKAELIKDGYIRDDKVVKTFALKPNFKESNFYKNGVIWYNKRIDNPNRKHKNLDYLKENLSVSYKIQGLELNEEVVDFKKTQSTQKLNLSQKEGSTITKKIKDIERHIFLKAISIKATQDNSVLQFENLKKELNISSIENLQNNKLADFEIQIITPATIKYDDIGNHYKLDMCMQFLDKFLLEFKEYIIPKKGSTFIAGNFKQFFAEPKTKTILCDGFSEETNREITNNKWYVIDNFYGTSDEKCLVDFINNHIGNLEDKFAEYYLLRNEEAYKIYDFDQGRGFQPDFILFLKAKKAKTLNDSFKVEVFYQIFIESKGKQFKGDDDTFMTGKEGWKEKFLQKISAEYGDKEIIKAENKDYRLFGFPFFNEIDHNDFDTKFTEVVEGKDHL